MRRASCQTLGLAVLALAAGAPVSMAFAQSAAPTPAPQRHLNWAGRGEFAMPVAAAPNQPNAPHRRSNRVIPHGVAYEAAPVAPTAAPEPPRRTLTPASAWLRPAAPAPAPPPVPVAPQPQPAPVARTVPDFIPDQGGRGQPVPAEIAQPAPVAAVAGPVDDPMAPRRDAPIFRMQQTPAPAPVQAAPEPQAQAQAAPAAPEPRRVATVTANPADRPAAQGARYYSVHRQAGREPDALTLPQPTYVDALAISTPVTIASQDLAQPEQAPTLIRDAQGRVRVQPAAPEGDYQ
ncbi:hypothetical protein [Brevundimonas sp.]|uniref:hypothetical protein n=1 Tax=Brevundimonas sp. TaxID=1871086 RepID=UPI003F7099B7